jgi:hypothetical protein
MKNKMETSKKFVIFTGIVFVFMLIFCVGSFLYFTLTGVMCDWTLLVTIATVSAAPFATATGFYFSKAKTENKIKLQTTFMKEKYKVLYDMGALDYERAQTEIEDEISDVETEIDAIDENVDEHIF